MQAVPGEPPETRIESLAATWAIDPAIVREACRTVAGGGGLLEPGDAEPLATARLGTRATAMLGVVNDALGSERAAAK